MPHFKHVLGVLVDSDSFVAKRPEYPQNHIFFDRFCFDMVSLLGKNLYDLNVLDIEYIFRKTHFTLSHGFGQAKGGIQLLEI